MSHCSSCLPTNHIKPMGIPYYSDVTGLEGATLQTTTFHMHMVASLKTFQHVISIDAVILVIKIRAKFRFLKYHTRCINMYDEAVNYVAGFWNLYKS